MDPTIEAIIEIPRGSRNKYEFDHETGQIRLDRVLGSAVHYPADYGFLPGTRAGDGDPLDVIVLVEEPTFPGCRVTVRPVGVLHMRDRTQEDDKIIAVLERDPRFAEIQTLADIGKHWLREIENFFATYKLLERVDVQVRGWEGREAAWQAIEQARLRGAT